MLLPDLNYKRVDGRIKTRSLEVHIVDHCNLRCADCCSLSPYLAKRFVSPEEMIHDLTLAGRAVRPTCLKLVGGEPLLHPQLHECLKAARSLELADFLSVTTNTLLLPKMPDTFWELVDAMTLSIYPSRKLSDEAMADVHAKADKFKVSLNVKHQPDFVQMTHWDRATETASKQKIFDQCWLRERCHIVDQGRFYMCTRPPHFHMLHNGKDSFQSDGIPLHNGPALVDEILEYLLRSEPLKTCLHCYGGNAELAPHRQLQSDEVAEVKELLS